MSFRVIALLGRQKCMLFPRYCSKPPATKVVHFIKEDAMRYLASAVLIMCSVNSYAEGGVED
jgi:hypothetical protein